MPYITDALKTYRFTVRLGAATNSVNLAGREDFAGLPAASLAAQQAYEMAGIKEPRKEIHIAEPYDPFDYKALHHLEGLQLAERGQAAQERVERVVPEPQFERAGRPAGVRPRQREPQRRRSGRGADRGDGA